MAFSTAAGIATIIWKLQVAREALVLTNSECFQCHAHLASNPEWPIQIKHKKTLIIKKERPCFAILLNT